MNRDVFVSYASDDMPSADLALEALEASGLRCWIAPRDVPPGSPYAEAIINAIRNSHVLVLIFSGKSNDSVHVLREIERAVSSKVPIITFRIDDALPTASMEYFISSQQWLDAFASPVEKHLDELVDAVTRMLQETKSHSSTGATNESITRQARRLMANVSVGKMGCALSITLLALFLIFMPGFLALIRKSPESSDVVENSGTVTPDDFASLDPVDLASAAPDDLASDQKEMERIVAMARQQAAAAISALASASGGSSGRAGRAARWVFTFNTTSPQDYLRQLGQLGAEIAFPHSDDKWQYYSNLNEAPRRESRNLDDEDRFFWIDEQSYEGIAEVLGEKDAKFMVVYLPTELEERLASLELQYQGANEDEILNTTFGVRLIGGGADIFVRDQRIR